MGATKKTALVMADGYEVRGGMDDLRAHFETAKALEQFKSGELLTWLEERYYDSIAAPIRTLKQEYDRLSVAASEEEAGKELYQALLPKDEDIARFLRDTLAVGQAASKGRVSEREAEKLEMLRKRTDDEMILSHAALTAFNQEDMAELLDAGEKTIYLCGREFEIPLRVEGVSYVGILGQPVVHVAAAVPEALKKRGISLSGVTIDCLEDETENFLAEIQDAMNCEMTDHVDVYLYPLVLWETIGKKSAIKSSIRQAAEEAETSLIETMAIRVNARMERLENIQEQYDRMCKERGVAAQHPTPTLEETRKALAEGHERIVRDLTGKLAEKLVSEARYEMFDFNLLHGSDYELNNANELDDISGQLQRKYIAQYDKRDMEGIVQAYLRSIRRSVEQLQKAEAKGRGYE